jgi:hypothetical protein
MSGGGLANVLFIILKVGLVMIMMVNGMAANYAKANANNRSEGEVNPIFRLFIYWCILLVMLLAYEFTETFKTIFFLYLMLIGAGLAQVRGIHIFIDKAARYHKDPATQRLMVNSLMVMYAIMFCLFGMANDGSFGAKCQKNAEYPVVY